MKIPSLKIPAAGAVVLGAVTSANADQPRTRDARSSLFVVALIVLVGPVVFVPTAMPALVPASTGFRGSRHDRIRSSRHRNSRDTRRNTRAASRPSSIAHRGCDTNPTRSRRERCSSSRRCPAAPSMARYDGPPMDLANAREGILA
jgi:hypothetical protein